ncbi:MAG: S8 family peptidase [Ignavibacteriae bacterium]|nr:S8 family peptidase [Ignavibacteriota bacterium]MCB9243948.1 S8 family peptidase [Ignavibacteriales bacterium]
MKKTLLKILSWAFYSLTLFALVLLLSDSGTSTGHSITSPTANEMVSNEIIVLLSKNSDVNSITSNNPEVTFTVKEAISRELNMWLINYHAPEGDSPQDILGNLMDNNNNILTAQFNYKVSLRENSPDDPRFDEQWGLSNTGQLGGTPNADIKALKAWDITTGGFTKDGKEIVIAVIDDGFFLQHSDLTFWKNDHEIPGNNVDDDGNGYVDDYDGWNAAQNNSVIIPQDHGTRVCGVIGAKGNNYNGIAGVNWRVSIMPIEIGTFPDIDEASVLKAYAYVLNQRKLYNQTGGLKGCYVVATNSSFGLDFEQPENHPIWCELYNLMGREGIISVAATMNNHSNVDVTGDVPTACSSDYLITVTSTTRTDELYGGSAYGPTTIDIGAPGVSILSTYNINQYSNAVGTSLAAPHVTGVVGLLYAAAHQTYIDYGNQYPDSLALLFKKFILGGTDQLGSLNGLIVSDGRLNLYKTLKSVERPLGSDNFIPTAYSLKQNYPNPFNPGTSIVYDVLDAVNVKISVFNILGQEVGVLVNSFQTKGRYTVHFDASSLPSGVYYYRIQSKYFSDVKKMVLLK